MLKSSDILKINAPILAGVFIFLSIIFTKQDLVFSTDPNYVIPVLNFDILDPRDWTYFVGFAFSVSSFSAIWGGIYEDFTEKKRYRISMYIAWAMMLVGFLFLSIGFLGISQLKFG